DAKSGREFRALWGSPFEKGRGLWPKNAAFLWHGHGRDHDRPRAACRVTQSTRATPPSRRRGLLQTFQLERFDEIEENRKTALGEPKHGHVFDIVARKL